PPAMLAPAACTWLATPPSDPPTSGTLPRTLNDLPRACTACPVRMAVWLSPERSESLIPMATPSPIQTSTHRPRTRSTAFGPTELGITLRRPGELGMNVLSVASARGPPCIQDDSLLKRR